MRNFVSNRLPPPDVDAALRADRPVGATISPTPTLIDAE
jgi:hypothetical protein